MADIKIAIEPNLAPVKEYLTSKGYDVDSINFNQSSANFNIGKYDALVVTGQNTNFMGIANTNSKAVVINASGLTPEQVFHEIELRFET